MPAGTPASAPAADGTPASPPAAPLGHLAHLGFALVGAGSVEDVARSLLVDLTGLPGVSRVGFALTEGGGRRLRFTASDRRVEGPVDWCLIDAYDDVPFTTVVRTGESFMGPREVFRPRWAEFESRQPEHVRAMAAVPLPGLGSPIGGIILYLDDEWPFDEPQRRLLEATARRAADAVRRVRAAGHDVDDDEPEADDDTQTARLVIDDDPRSAGQARRFLRQFLAEAELTGDLVDTAELCLSELVTNAILHAGSRTELRLHLDASLSVLTVSVRDRGGAVSESPVPDGDPDPLRVHGRGLQLVEALADRWGSERDHVGTTVWFALEIDGERAEASHAG